MGIIFGNVMKRIPNFRSYAPLAQVALSVSGSGPVHAKRLNEENE